MDWSTTGAAARAILTALLRYSYPVDSQSLLQTANENTPDWDSRENALRENYQALDLLERLNLVTQPDGASYQVTPAGRNASIQDLPFWLALLDSPVVKEWAAVEDLREASARGRWTRGANTFRRLELHNWRQFEDVGVDFHPRLTILTGVNGAGKTTLLNVLASHFSWQAQLISSRATQSPDDGVATRVGSLFYTNGVKTAVNEPAITQTGINYLQLPSAQQVPGIFISSHRSISGYQALEHLPAKFSSSDTLLSQFASEIKSRYSGSNSRFSPTYRMKEALVAAAMYSYGNAAIRANPEARDVWEGFQEVLSNLLPKSMAFDRLVVEEGDVWMETASARFPIEAVSGGVSAMLELAWQIFLRGRDSESFTVCIDEPENHLHPELQREIVPALLEAFPRATFIVATHSPFVVTGSPDSYVYALQTGEGGRVTPRQVNGFKASGTSDETLMGVLGLQTPLPLWAEERLRDAIAAVPADPSAEDLRRLRGELKAAGLGDQFPAAVDALRPSGGLE
ncbi:AAA family ATPase [Microbacterium sp. che218]|uniref:AAA family ATPase n=1 Tax=Microbacterium sp. che218 TaxID=3140649 RepID=UPI0033675FFF